MNLTQQLTDALVAVEGIDRAVVNNLNRFAAMFLKHLRDVSPYFLKRLKRALRDFDIRTGEWK